MQGLSKVFIVIIVSVILNGCTPPIGSIGGNATVSGTGLLVQPKRDIYDVFQQFVRKTDLYVYISQRGIMRHVPVDQVDIFIIEDVNKLHERNRVRGNLYIFEKKGMKLVVVEFNGMSDEYYIDVKDASDYPPYGGDGSGDHGSGIKVGWKPKS